MAKTATIRAVRSSAASAAVLAAKAAATAAFAAETAAALAAGKIPAPPMERVLSDEVWAEFSAQVEAPKLNQRPHEDQVDTGMWDHLKTVVSTQATLEVVEVYRVNRRGRRIFVRRCLVDGYHRLYYWFCVAKAGCPFHQLNLVVHQMEVKEGADDEDIAEAIDELARTINSKQSVKRNADFITAALREAAAGAPKFASKAYKLGHRSVSYLKRTVGDPAKLSGPKLKAAAAAEMTAHRAMDKLFALTETDLAVRKHATQLFHTGIAKAIFDVMARIGTERGCAFAVTELTLALGHAAGAPVAHAGAMSALGLKLSARLRELADPLTDAALRAAGGNREGFYTKVAEYMATELKALLTSASKRK